MIYSILNCEGRDCALSSFMLRALALAAMVVDHAGLALFPGAPLFRCVGRLAFPLYCFLLVQGYAHTQDLRAYGRRLLLLALISEIPFDWLIFGRAACAMEQNVVFSLLLGLLALHAADAYAERPLPASLCLLAVFITSMLARVSYGWLGVALCLSFYRTQGSRRNQALSVLLLEGLYCLSLALSGVKASWVLTSLCAMFAAVPIFLYSGRKGLRCRALTFLFYAAYPAHIIALLILRALRVVPPYFLG